MSYVIEGLVLQFVVWFIGLAVFLLVLWVGYTVYEFMNRTTTLLEKIAKELNVNADEDEEEKSAPDKGGKE